MAELLSEILAGLPQLWYEDPPGVRHWVRDEVLKLEAEVARWRRSANVMSGLVSDHTIVAGERAGDFAAALTRVTELEQAIRTHRDQRADDRCIEDDDRLYAALGDGIPCDRRVGDKDAMLANCRRFIERRCEGGGWPSYVELERALRSLIGEVTSVLIGGGDGPDEACQECGLGGVGYLRDEIKSARTLLGEPNPGSESEAEK